MSAPRSGTAAAVHQAMEDAGPPPPAQPLLPLADAEAVVDGIEAGRRLDQAVTEARRAGRPKGSLNKRTEAFRSMILGKYAHPGEVLASIYSRPVDVLAAELGCTKLEAMDRQIKAAAELLPFVESKMPVAVGVSAEGQIQLVLAAGDGDGGARQIVDGGELKGLDALAMAIVQNQGDSE